MDNNKINKINKIFISSLNLGQKTNLTKLRYTDKNWDSVAHMHLIAQLEKNFKIAIDPEDIVDMSSYKKALEILKRYFK